MSSPITAHDIATAEHLPPDEAVAGGAPHRRRGRPAWLSAAAIVGIGVLALWVIVAAHDPAVDAAPTARPER